MSLWTLLSKKKSLPAIPPSQGRKTPRDYDNFLYGLRHLVRNAFLKLKQCAALPQGMPKIHHPSRQLPISGILPFGPQLIDDIVDEMISGLSYSSLDKNLAEKGRDLNSWYLLSTHDFQSEPGVFGRLTVPEKPWEYSIREYRGETGKLHFHRGSMYGGMYAFIKKGLRVDWKRFFH